MSSLFINISLMAVGGWINWTFSGFVVANIPFSTSYNSNSMLQKGIKLESLYSSMMPKYYLEFFGFRSSFPDKNKSSDTIDVKLDHSNMIKQNVLRNVQSELEKLHADENADSMEKYEEFFLTKYAVPENK